MPTRVAATTHRDRVIAQESIIRTPAAPSRTPGTRVGGITLAAALLLSASLSTLAFAAGGTGGASLGGQAGGAGGAGPNGGVGLPGASDGNEGGGGGGGGSGSGANNGGIGGSGGNGSDGAGATGGAGGSAASFGGTPGNDSTNTAGAGGGGGGYAALNGSFNNPGGVTAAGGEGGYGGFQFDFGANSGGGGGGEGGYGAVVATAGTSTNTGTLQGGTGGYGGSTVSGSGGNGGDGGIGAYFAAAGSVLTNAGTISGGDGGFGGDNNTIPSAGGAGGAGGVGVFGVGLTINNSGGTIFGGTGGGGGVGGEGAGGAIYGAAGAGGIGIMGANLTIDNDAGGMIAGGVSGDGTTQAYAIQLTGGTNYVGPGGTITGGIDVLGGSFQPALPGSAVGTPLMVGGPVAFAPGSIYAIRVTPLASDSIQAIAVAAAPQGGAPIYFPATPALIGTATLGSAAVAVTAGGGPIAPGMRYTILSATDGVSGTFSGVTSNLAFFAPTLSYDATDVFLTAAYNYLIPGATQNQRAVGTGLNNAARLNGGSGALLAGLDQVPVGTGGAVLDSLSGEGIAAAQNLAHREAQLFTSAIFDQTTFYGSDRGGANQIVLTAPTSGGGFQALAPADADRLKVQPIRELADLPSSRPAFIAPVAVAPTRTWRAWGSGFGGDEEIHSNAAIGYAAQSNQIYGGAVGVDYQITPNYLAGVAVGGSDGEFSVPNRSTSGSTTGGHIAFYDLAEFGPYYGASSTSASFYQNRTTRVVAGFGGLGTETERGSFFSDEFRSRLEFGRHFANLFGTGSATIVTPFIALELAELRTNGSASRPSPVARRASPADPGCSPSTCRGRARRTCRASSAHGSRA